MKLRFRISLFVLSAAVLAALPLAAAEVKIFRGDTREAALEGTLDALSVGPLGSLELARKVERLAMPEEPFIFAAAAHPEGWVLGTGNSGKVLLVSKTGKVEELFAADEPEVFAVAVGKDGAVYAASSPYGKVYRKDAGADEAQTVVEPGEAYIWDLAFDSSGRLLVATGLAGKLYRVDPRGDGSVQGESSGELLYESADSHVRAIQAMENGRILLGTAGQGLLLELDTSQTGKTEVTTLFDAVQPEVLDFTVGDDGAVYVAALASEASRVQLSQTQPPPPPAEGKKEGEGKVTVSTTQETLGSRGSGYKGPRSLLLRVDAGGDVSELLDFDDETVHSLLWHDGALWIGTGEEGRLYRYRDERLILERDLEESQVTALVGGDDAAAVTTNGAALYRILDDTVAEGTFTSQVLDAGQVARFGTFLWEGSLPDGAGFELEVRSGMSSTPDATWTPWRKAAARVTPRGASRGGEVSLADLPHGRFAQWRAQLSGKPGDGPRLVASELSYRQQNLEPRITKLEILDPGEILVPSNFNPQNQIFEPWSPNREGIFTSLKPAKEKDSSRLKTLWKKGFRSLRWTASDANEDDLIYRLDFQPESNGAPWLAIVEKLEDEHYSFDSTVLPDGVYRFRLTASDEPSQSDDETLVADKLSEPVVIDHTPPTLGKVSRQGHRVEVELRDNLSPLRHVVYSIDAAPWKNAAVEDGLLDGRREVMVIEVPEDAHMLLVRAADAAFNTFTFDLTNAGE